MRVDSEWRGKRKNGSRPMQVRRQKSSHLVLDQRKRAVAMTMGSKFMPDDSGLTYKMAVVDNKLSKFSNNTLWASRAGRTDRRTTWNRSQNLLINSCKKLGSFFAEAQQLMDDCNRHAMVHNSSIWQTTSSTSYQSMGISRNHWDRRWCLRGSDSFNSRFRK